jgi:hypothetical protein
MVVLAAATGLLVAASAVTATNVYRIPLKSRGLRTRQAAPAGDNVQVYDWFNRTDNEVGLHEKNALGMSD